MSALVLAHGSGIDEIAFVVLPVITFVVLQWLIRRRSPHQGADQQKNAATGTNDAAAR